MLVAHIGQAMVGKLVVTILVLFSIILIGEQSSYIPKSSINYNQTNMVTPVVSNPLDTLRRKNRTTLFEIESKLKDYDIRRKTN